MSCQNPACIGNYDFNHIAFYALKRFVEGVSTIELLASAINEREKEEIALVSLLDVEDNEIRGLKLCCKRARQCEAISCRHKLKSMITKELAKVHNS
jgi:hypothetical protein